MYKQFIKPALHYYKDGAVDVVCDLGIIVHIRHTQVLENDKKKNYPFGDSVGKILELTNTYIVLDISKDYTSMIITIPYDCIESVKYGGKKDE